MIRRIVFEAFLFLLPFGLYAIYLRLAGPQRNGEETARNHPWVVLFISGLVLVAASFLLWGVTEGSGEQGTYVAPHLVNGQVVPGHVEKTPP